jgi:hypothetical protein
MTGRLLLLPNGDTPSLYGEPAPVFRCSPKGLSIKSRVLAENGSRLPSDGGVS